MALGEVATSGNVEDFRGFYVSDGLTIQPMKFFVPDLYSNNFNELDSFARLMRLVKITSATLDKMIAMCYTIYIEKK